MITSYYTTKLGLEPETITYKNRVEADGGEVIDLAYVDSVYKKVKEFGVLANLKHWTSARAGIKKDVNNFVSKTYSLVGNDGFQNTGSEQPVLSANKIDFDGVNDSLQLSDNTSDFSFLQNTGVFTVNVNVSLNDYTDLKLNSFLISSDGGTSNKGLGFWYDNRDNAKILNFNLFRGVAGSPYGQISINNIISDNNNHDFTVTGNSSKIDAFLDNNFRTSSNLVTPSVGDNTAPLHFGLFPNGSFPLDGQSKKFYIFNTPLTQSQITELNAL